MPTKFTDRYMAALKLEQGKDRLVFDAACPGLGVRVTAKGTKIFVAQWTDPATRRKVREPLGVWGSITVDQAREAARARLGAVAKGIDPRAERRRQRAEADRERAEAALTLNALLEEWQALHLAHRRERYRAEALRAMRRIFPDLLKQPAARLTRGEIVNRLDRLVRAGKPAMAACTLRYGRAAFGWAERRGKVPSNPFQGLPIPAGSAVRNRVLDDAEIREVWTSAGALPSPWREFFRISLLTLQRRREVAGMRWSEVTDDLSRWTIPGSRMKNGQPHIVHLSEAAWDILRSIPRVRGSDHLFTTNHRAPISGISKPKLELDTAIARARDTAAEEAGLRPEPLLPWRLHDLRRSGVSWLAGAGYDAIVADKILGHAPQKLSAVARIYQQHDFLRERAAALDAWARFVTEQPEHPNILRLIRA